MSSISNKSEYQITTVPANTVNCDVLVIGAGASGIPAAIAAARQGAKVILLEEDLVPGGAPVDMSVAMLCGGSRVGIFLEMSQRLNKLYNLTGKPVENFIDGLDGKDYWYMPSSYLQVLREMMRNETNLTLKCGSPVNKVIVTDDGNRRRINGVGAAAGIAVALTANLKTNIRDISIKDMQNQIKILNKPVIF